MGAMTTSPSQPSRTRLSSNAVSAASPIPVLQRRCTSCEGGGTGLSGQCASCDSEERFGTTGLQTKLTVNTPGDIFEHEADRVADQVMRTEAAHPVAPQISPLLQDQESVQSAEELQTARNETAERLQRQELEEEEEELQTKRLQRQENIEEEEEELQAKRLQRQEAAEEEEEELQTKSAGGSSSAASRPGFARMLRAETAGGAPLDREARAFFEPRFGRDLGDVRIHTGGRAASLSRDINARAFTHQRHVYFGAGAYDAKSTEGRRLIAHELTHTVQQAGSTPNPHPQTIGPFGPAASAAEVSADDFASGLPAAHPGIGLLPRRERREEDQILQAPPEGRHLIAHELTHTVQQGVLGQTPSLQRRNIFEEFAGLFRSDDIPDDELREYLEFLRTNDRIEDFTDSDNKARAAVNRLRGKQKLFGFALTPDLRKLLILEMQSGFTGNPDEEAILYLLTSTDIRTVQSLFEGENALDEEGLLSDFHGSQRRSLLNLYAAAGLEVENLERRENFENCSDPEREAVQEGMNLRQRDLQQAITFMDQHPDSPSIPIAFWLAFRVSEPGPELREDMLENLRAIREGIRRSHYICDHGEAADSSCNREALGH